MFSQDLWWEIIIALKFMSRYLWKITNYGHDIFGRPQITHVIYWRPTFQFHGLIEFHFPENWLNFGNSNQQFRRCNFKGHIFDFDFYCWEKNAFEKFSHFLLLYFWSNFARAKLLYHHCYDEPDLTIRKINS